MTSLGAEPCPEWLAQADLPKFLALRRIVRSVWRSARKRAAEGGLPFTLTLMQAEQLLEDQRLQCAVSGIPFSERSAGEGSFRSPFRPSLDRISNPKGYVPGNVRFVLTIVNLAMNDWGEGPLLEVALAIARKATHDPRNRGISRVKLTDTAVLAILSDTTKTEWELAGAYGVCRDTITKIRSGKTWKHVHAKHVAAA